MRVFAIGDLHLSHAQPKPMDVFGGHWTGHAEKIAKNWDQVVDEDDLVVICGDHSWAIRPDEAQEDINYIAARPGKKVLIRGNHDYWWKRDQTNRLQKTMPEDIFLVHGRCMVFGEIAVAGTRGWRLETEEDAGDEKVLEREKMYFERALAEMDAAHVKIRIAALHYPPFDADLRPNVFSDILEKHKVDHLVYGHIHGSNYVENGVCGTKYHLTSVDMVGFAPVRIV